MEWLERYTQKITENKFNSVIYSLIMGSTMFVVFFAFNKFSGQTLKESGIIAGGVGVFFFLVWILFSLNLVRREDLKKVKEAEEKAREIEKRRAKLAQGKVNNKKKKKQRKN